MSYSHIKKLVHKTIKKIYIHVYIYIYIYMVKPVYKGHLRKCDNVPFIYRLNLYAPLINEKN